MDSSDFETESESDSDSGADIEPPSLDLTPSEPSSGTSTPKHSIGARIQAIILLELNIHHLQITSRTGISKAQIYKLRDKAISRGWDPKVSGIVEVHHVVSSMPSIPSISGMTVWRTLKENGYSSFKKTIKPGLKNEDKLTRLEWCLEHEHWILEDWKNVIWTDETSVQLGAVRGKRRVWRKSDEAFHPHVITRRWKGFSEFMW